MGKKEQSVTKVYQAAPVTWAQAVRDILRGSMNKGQFPLALSGLIVIIFLLRLPQADLSELAHAIIDALKAFELFGYVLWVATVALWFRHAKWQRRTSAAEVDRMAIERNAAQAAAIDAPLESTK